VFRPDAVFCQFIEHETANGIVGDTGQQTDRQPVAGKAGRNVAGRTAQSCGETGSVLGLRARRIGVKIHSRAPENHEFRSRI